MNFQTLRMVEDDSDMHALGLQLLRVGDTLSTAVTRWTITSCPQMKNMAKTLLLALKWRSYTLSHCEAASQTASCHKTPGD